MLSSGAESSRATLSRPANIDGTGYILQILQLYGVDRDTKQLKHRWADVVGRDSDLLNYVGIEVGGVTWTTWMTEIIDLIVNNGDVQKCQRDAVYKRIRMLEFALPGLIPPGTEVLTQTLPPRIMRTHLPITYLPKSFWENKCKIIYVARSAKDVVVSYYYFRLANNLHSHPGTFAQHFEDFMAGNVSFGSWYEHVKGWWSKRNELRLLYVFYEDMKEDLEREIRKLLTFLEKDMDEEVLKKIVHHASFEVMKDNPMANFKTHEAFDHNASPFMRKGITGDWKNHFTVAQNQRFNEDYAEKMEGSLLPFRMEH